MRLGRGAVVVVELDPTIGHEQHGVRPCVVVSDPDIDCLNSQSILVTASNRFPELPVPLFRSSVSIQCPTVHPFRFVISLS